MPIDLHVHSTESDGTFSPKQIVDTAKAESIGTVALCDHDTTSGLEQFISYAKNRGINGITGVEISASSFAGECHILGLNFPLYYIPLENALAKYRDARSQRNLKIIEKLHNLGVTVSIDELNTYAKGTVAGRPHIARLLIDKGVAISIDDAFDRFLAQGAIAYVERPKMDPFEMVSLLKRSGATVVLAHPGLLRMTETELENFVCALVKIGLDALEVFTPHNTDEQIQFLMTLADKFKIGCSGGSDFHGDNKPGHRIGFYREALMVPELVKDIIAVKGKKT
jgi:predicted metal-dependent phosphoesterase TrpH